MGDVLQAEVRPPALVATALGCPYGKSGEQAMLADDQMHEILKPTDGFKEEDDELVFLETVAEAQNNALNISRAILACETCQGNPHTVDLTDKVCAFALDACMGNVGNPIDVNQYLESRDDFGN